VLDADKSQQYILAHLLCQHYIRANSRLSNEHRR
jgi:hypothetical protein